jgi:MoaA/NifB/PqqE/SkfB family radical SAM enzyme
MVYTPRLDYLSSEMVRRLSWAFQLPMTKTIENIIKCYPLLIESSLVCNTCKERKICHKCIFSSSYEVRGEAAKSLDKVSA